MTFCFCGVNENNLKIIGKIFGSLNYLYYLCKDLNLKELLMNGFTEYKSPKKRLGIDDLRSEYAFHGNSQGDDSMTNSVEDYISSGGWKSVSVWFNNIDYRNQQEVDKRVLEIKLFNLDRINKLKESGEYGKPVDGIKIFIQHDQLYDDIKDKYLNKNTAYRFDYLNLSR